MGVARRNTTRLLLHLDKILNESERQSNMGCHKHEIAKSTRRRAKNTHADRSFGSSQMKEMNESEFKRHFRMSRSAFYRLLDLVKPWIEKDHVKAIASSGSPVTPETSLAIALRWLAGGSYLDIARLYGVSVSNFFHERGPLRCTLAAIDRVLDITFSYDPVVLENVAMDFAQFSNGRLGHCVGAVDGWVLETRKPSIKEVHEINIYFNRKQVWGMIAMASCDAHLRFNLFAVTHSGSTHDAVAWEHTSLKHSIDRGKLPKEYYLIADEAFVNGEQLLVPWSGRGIGAYKDSFNYHLSAMRQSIERAFGLLTKRWGIFWRPLNCRFSMWPTIAVVCAKLHNWCIENNDLDPGARLNEDVQTTDVWRVLDNNSQLPNETEYGNIERESFRMSRPRGDRRREITAQLELLGIKRPNFATTQTKY